MVEPWKSVLRIVSTMVYSPAAGKKKKKSM